MRRFAAVLIVTAVSAAAAFGADDPVTRAMKLIEKHRYEDAAKEIRDAAPSGPTASLALGIAFLKNAELHRELYQVSAAITLDYLKRLAADQGKSRSRYGVLYYGLALLESGKAEAAQAAFDAFLLDQGVEPKFRSLAMVASGLAWHLRGDGQKAQDAWTGIESGDPDVQSQLAAAYSRAGLAEKNPAGLCDESVASMNKAGKGSSPHVVRNCIGVYEKAGMPNRAAELVKKADLKAFSYRELQSKSKILSFYDLSLLGNLAGFYLQSAITALEKAAADGQMKSTASYYLGEAHALAGNTDQSSRYFAAFLASGQAPPQIRSKAIVRQAANQYQKGKRFEAIGVWDETARKQPIEFETLAEVLVTCGQLRIDCPAVVKGATAAVESSDGRKTSVLSVGLGRYYLAKRDYAKAVMYLEAGRDKGNKNKIEANDPLMLTGLSEAYYRTKKFSEALEIYFEMSKQYPQVRQIQEALQGVYSVEHKSAGDVKIN